MTKVVENAFLSYGVSDAPVKVEVFLNLACPYCATFFEAADEVLSPYINVVKFNMLSSTMTNHGKCCYMVL